MHEHHHHHHDHAPPAGAANMDARFIVGILLNVAFVVAEVIFGIVADSMALLTDAAHNLSDVLGLSLAWWAAVLARKRPTENRTYGFRKATILAALANAMLVLVAVGAIAWEAAMRIEDPPAVSGNIMMVVAAIGVVVNAVAALLFFKERKRDINIRAAFVHLAADAAVSVGVVVAGLAIFATGMSWIDPVVSLAIAAVIVVGTWSLLKGSFDLAMDAVPPHIDSKAVESCLVELEGVRDVHDLHIWAMSATENALTAHLTTETPWSSERLRQVGRELAHRFHIDHVTIQVEPADGCKDPCPQEAEDAV
jgi:cobalt-zinc-cadmium efflux system protein